MTRDSPKWTLKSGPCDRERRGSGPAKQKPNHNPCRPVGRIWKVPLWREITGTWTPECLARADLIVLNPKGIPKRSSKMRSGIVHHKSDRKSCVLPTADRNNKDTQYCKLKMWPMEIQGKLHYFVSLVIILRVILPYSELSMVDRTRKT